MIDLHSHLLPGIDDGSRSVEQSVATLRQFAADGVTDSYEPEASVGGSAPFASVYPSPCDFRLTPVPGIGGP